MHQISVATSIDASPIQCFDLARSIRNHVESASRTNERIVNFPPTDLMGLGDEVTFEGRHFRVTQRLSSRITQFNPPTYFQDRMISGPFRFFEHDHFFEAKSGGTLMTDVVRFAAPLGPLGWIAERILLAGHLRNFLIQRAKVVKSRAEIRV